MRLADKRKWLDSVSRYFQNEIYVSKEVSDFIACQFALESDFGQSLIARNACNYGGMKLALVRPTTSCSSYHEHANYFSVRDFYWDYMLWLSWYHFTQFQLHSLDLFAEHLSTSGYCPSPNYIESIMKIYNQFFVEPQNI